MRRIVLCAVFLASSAFAQTAPDPVYVAMGSSFAAGPGIPKADPVGPARCGRSTENYAHLLAARYGLVLNDVSCSGATTADILDGSPSLPAQLDAVTPATRLITVTIGGNDVGFIRNLYAWSCQNEAANQPSAASSKSRPCGNPMSPADVETAFAGLQARLESIVTRIHERAPQARVVFVDYIHIVPESGACSARLPLTGDQLEQARSVARRLATLTADAAKATGALVLKASDLSEKHDVCATDAWATPYHRPADAPAGPFAPYHPNAEAMRAIAAKLGNALQSEVLAPSDSTAPARPSKNN